MDVIETSPWCVTNLDELMYYCCPQCDKKDKNKNSFLKHAFDEHPEAKKHLEMFAVKEELIIKQNPEIIKIDCDPFMDIYIKQEKTDDFELPQDINLKDNLIKSETSEINNVMDHYKTLVESIKFQK